MKKINVTTLKVLSDRAEKRYLNTFIQKERGEIILKSGKPNSSKTIDLKTGETYFLPKIGKFIFCHKSNKRKDADEAFWLALDIAEILKGATNGK